MDDVVHPAPTAARHALDAQRAAPARLTARAVGVGAVGQRAFEVAWDRLLLVANCGEEPVEAEAPAAAPFWSLDEPGEPWSVAWWLR